MMCLEIKLCNTCPWTTVCFYFGLCVFQKLEMGGYENLQEELSKCLLCCVCQESEEEKVHDQHVNSLASLSVCFVFHLD